MKIKYTFLFSSLFLLGCTKDSDVASDNEFRAFTSCIDQSATQFTGLPGVNHKLTVGTVPTGKQWSILNVNNQDLYFFIQIDDLVISLDTSADPQFPIYVNEGQTLSIHGSESVNSNTNNSIYYTQCISINEYNID